MPRGQGGEEPHCGSPEGEALWEKCGDRKANQASPSIAPNKPNTPKCGAAKKQSNAPKPPHLSNAQTQSAPHFLPRVLLMSAKPAKSEAILRRTNIKPKQGRQPLPSPALSMIILSKSLLCTVAYRFCAFQDFVQGRAPLKRFACGRLTRKIPLSQGFSSCITVHRTVIQFTFFGAPFGMGVSPPAGGDDRGCSPPSTPSATAGASLHPALFKFTLGC